jgi:hypothetical protein
MSDRKPFPLWPACIAALMLLSSAAAWSEPAAKHLGVATCANSVCHGRGNVAEDSNIAQNEYRIWAKYDPHAQAYQTLLNADSKRIAANMGLADASTAPACLACHSDNVPAEQRGERFFINDGIGCEACHGGAERWIDSHYAARNEPEAYQATHQRSLEQGLLKTEAPEVLAGVCQGCHLGNSERFASHEMMAAGHPRLRFELDTWSTLMPAHHVLDADYQQRKGPVDNSRRWLTGKLHAADNYLSQLKQHAGQATVFPELAVFDCHSCHRPMDTGVQRLAAEKSMVRAGTVHINDSELRILRVITAQRDAALAERLSGNTAELHRAALTNRQQFLDSLSAVRADIGDIGALFAERPLSDGEIRALPQQLLKQAAAGQFRDYADAEQLFLALQLLAISQDGKIEKPYQRLFRLLEDEQGYAPRRIMAEAQRLLQSGSME